MERCSLCGGSLLKYSETFQEGDICKNCAPDSEAAAIILNAIEDIVVDARHYTKSPNMLISKVLSSPILKERLKNRS